MSFYVTLASSVDYAGNKQNDFTTILSEPINLSGQYEVALAQMHYSPLIFTDIGSIEIQKSADSFLFALMNTIKFNIKIPNATRMEDLCSYINLEINKRIQAHHRAILYKAFMYNWYQSNLTFKAKLELQTKMTTAAFLLANKVRLLVGRIGLNFVYFSSVWDPAKILLHEKLKEIAGETEIKYDTIFKYLKISILGFKRLQENAMFDFEVINCPAEHIYKPDKLYVLENLPDDIIYNYFDPEVNEPSRVKFTYDPITHQVQINSILVEKIKVKGMIARIFTKSSDEFEIKTQKLTFYHLPSKLDPIQFAYVYTDIIENQVIGDKYTSLLKVIPIATENEASSSIVSYFDNLHYVNVKTNRITRINISIRTTTGELIKFGNDLANVIIKLHFRKKESD